MSKKASLENLMLFYELINSGSINKASLDLKIPKSSISRRLGDLEEFYKCNLVNRGNSGLVLTEMGRLLYEKCGLISSEVNEAQDLISSTNESLVGSLRIKLPTDFWMSWLGEIISDYSAKYSQVKLEVIVSDIPADVSVEPFDLSIHIGGIPNLDINQKIIGTLERGFYTSPDYIINFANGIQAKDALDYNLLIIGSQISESVLIGGSRFLLSEFKSKINTNSVGFSLSLATLGHGIALLPKRLCQAHVREGKLVEVFEGSTVSPLMVTAGFLGVKNRSKKINVFLDMLVNSI